MTILFQDKTTMIHGYMATFLWWNYDKYIFCSSCFHFPSMMWKEIFLPIPQMHKLKLRWLVNSIKRRSYDGRIMYFWNFILRRHPWVMFVTAVTLRAYVLILMMAGTQFWPSIATFEYCHNSFRTRNLALSLCSYFGSDPNTYYWLGPLACASDFNFYDV